MIAPTGRLVSLAHIRTSQSIVIGTDLVKAITALLSMVTRVIASTDFLEFAVASSLHAAPLRRDVFIVPDLQSRRIHKQIFRPFLALPRQPLRVQRFEL